MRTFISFIMISLLSFGFIWQDAQAKRFGGGRSFGIQRPMNSFSRAAPKPPASAIAGKTNTNKWGGMLGGLFGGLLLGGLLTSLFMGNGLATGLLTWIIVGAVILFLVSLFRARRATGSNQASNFNSYHASTNPRADYPSSGGFMSMAKNLMNDSNTKNEQYNNQYQFNNYGSDDSDEDFLRDAKVKFIRLQAAYDQKNMEDLREFTSPEVLAEIQMQYHEQEGAVNETEVVSLEAELLNKEKDGDTEVASVRFTGLIKENSDKAEPLHEIWHFEKSGASGKWMVSGVQQVKPL